MEQTTDLTIQQAIASGKLFRREGQKLWLMVMLSRDSFMDEEGDEWELLPSDIAAKDWEVKV